MTVTMTCIAKRHSHDRWLYTLANENGNVTIYLATDLFCDLDDTVTVQFAKILQGDQPCTATHPPKTTTPTTTTTTTTFGATPATR